jgi:transposase
MKADAKRIKQIMDNPLWASQPGFSVLKSQITEHIDKVCERTTEATGISKRTLTTIINEQDTGSFKSPFKNRKRQPKYEPNSLEISVIRDSIQTYHIYHREMVTMEKLRTLLRENIHFKGSYSTLRRLVLELGFKWRKTVNNRSVLIERYDIKKLRYDYLKKMAQYRKENRCIVYTDESYVLTNHVQNQGWGDENGPPLKKKLSKGQRFIIVHAGSQSGFVPNAMLTYKAATTSGDYHSNMNAENYKKWITELLIPNIPSNSVVVMDNAAYHNVRAERAPSSNSRKLVMQNWLQSHSIPYEETMKKVELYAIVKQNKPNFIKYIIDELFNSHGIEVLRLPPYHPNLNPIENIWGILKRNIASKNIGQKSEDMKILINQCASEITPEMWYNTCRHVREEEEKYYSHFDDDEDFIIELNDSSSESLLASESDDSEWETDFVPL